MWGKVTDDLLIDGSHFEISSTIYRQNYMPKYHFHDHYEILYLKKGTRSLLVNNITSYTITDHSIALIKPYILHQTFATDDLQQTRILVNISQTLMDDIMKFSSGNITSCFDYVVLPLENHDIWLINFIFAALLSQKKDDKMYTESIKVLCAGLLLVLCASCESLQNNAIPESSEYVDKSLKYINEHFSQNITVPDIAEHVHLSEVHFSRLFKQYVGMTPHKYLLQIRIINAKKCLRKKKRHQCPLSQKSAVFDLLKPFLALFSRLQALRRGNTKKSFTFDSKYQSPLLHGH